jgi:hypothetical protein
MIKMVEVPGFEPGCPPRMDLQRGSVLHAGLSGFCLEDKTATLAGESIDDIDNKRLSWDALAYSRAPNLPPLPEYPHAEADCAHAGLAVCREDKELF